MLLTPTDRAIARRWAQRTEPPNAVLFQPALIRKGARASPDQSQGRSGAKSPTRDRRPSFRCVVLTDSLMQRLSGVSQVMLRRSRTAT